MVWLGIVIGFIVGALRHAMVGRLGRRLRRLHRCAGVAIAQPGQGAGSGTPRRRRRPRRRGRRRGRVADVARRLDAIEARLAALERGTGAAPPATTPADAAPSRPGEPVLRAAPPATAHAEVAPQAAAAAPARGRRQSSRRRRSRRSPTASRARRTARSGPLRRPPHRRCRPRRARPSAPPPAPNPLWAWFTGGNALTRIGVVALFFGVAFLLKYFAEIVTVPIEAKLVGVAIAGGALAALGMRLAGTRPGLWPVAAGRRRGHPLPHDLRRAAPVRRAAGRARVRAAGRDRRGHRVAGDPRRIRRRWPGSRSPAASSRRSWWRPRPASRHCCSATSRC